MNPPANNPPATSPRRIGIQAKVLLLTSALVGYFVASQLWAVVQLHESTRIIEGQAQAVRDQSQVLTTETKIGGHLKLMQTLIITLGDLRYWSVDLALTLQTDSEKRAQAAHKAVAPLLTALAPSEPALINAIQPMITDYVKLMAAAADAYTDSNRVLGNSLGSQGQQKIVSVMEQLTGRLETLEGETVAARARLQTAADKVGVSGQAVISKNQNLVHLTYAILIGAVLIGTLSVIYLARSVFRHFGGLIAALKRSAAETTTAAAQIAVGSQTLAEGASQQAASLEETGASLEESRASLESASASLISLTSMVQLNADAATKAKTLTGETRAAADTGATDMAAMKNAMDEIQTSSRNIAKIIKTIDEIAFQTNILALNAAVEAARAGDAGMGFAVVADEVRNLAQRSAQSAKETADKIETAIGKSEQGVQISAKVAANFDQITTKTREVDQYVAEIATACQEQTQGISQVSTAVSQVSSGVVQISTAVTQMDTVTQGNAASSEESASAAEELSTQAQTMLEAVGALQDLVGSGTQTSTTPRPTPIPEAQPTAHASVRAHTQSRSNGNGHRKPAPNGSALPASRKTPVEVADDDFKDF